MGNSGNSDCFVIFILASMKQKNLILAIGINIVITIIEIIVGLLIGSLAIISDAVHNFFDVGAMVLSFLGERASEKKMDVRHTYGFKRTEILVALLNSAFLLVSIGFIGYEAVKRLIYPQTISRGWMLVMAVVAFIGNMLATKLLHDHAEESMNIRSAFLHSLQDALFSAGVIVAAILVLVFNWQWADAGISLMLSVLLAREVMGLIMETVHILMEGVPEDLNLDKLKNDLMMLSGIQDVNDLHVWSTGSKDIILTAHIVADLKDDSDHLKRFKSIKEFLYSKYKISHSTTQLVPATIQPKLQDVCKHCN